MNLEANSRVLTGAGMSILMKRLFFLVLVLGLTSRRGAVAATTRRHHAATSSVTYHFAGRRSNTAVRHSSTRGRHGRSTVRVVTYVRGRNGRLRRAVLVRHRYYEHFTGDSFAETDLTASDSVAGEDPVVRQAALEALGNMNGTVVAIDPNSGRILAMVNQKRSRAAQSLAPPSRSRLR